MANQLTRYATVATVDTAGEGLFYAVTIHAPRPGVNTVGTIDQVRVHQFVLPFRATINRIMTEVTTGGGAGKKYGVGLYDVAKNLLVETGALDANTVQANETTVTQITFEPGVYWIASTSDSASTQLRIANSETVFKHLMTTVRMGTAANAAGSPGVLPSTLGAISTGQKEPPLCAFYLE